MGRWSRPLARAFVEWLDPAPGAHWLDFGCGTGALTAAICDLAGPASVVGCDPTGHFLEHARAQLPDARATFVGAGADALPRRAGGYDAIVSGLVVNFLRDPADTMSAVRERLRPGGRFAAYVWDYADGMELLRFFWDEATALDSGAAALDEGRRFPLCQEAAMASLAREAGFTRVETHALVIPTDFAGFDDYWAPFLRGTGPAPGYVASLEPARQASLREQLRRRLPAARDGSIHLRARAWAVQGVA
jgi:SAM-dependent methyltransferase